MGNWGVLIRELALIIISRQEPGDRHPTPGRPPLRLRAFEAQDPRLQCQNAERGMAPLLV